MRDGIDQNNDCTQSIRRIKPQKHRSLGA
jgi:hypothetical protein